MNRPLSVPDRQAPDGVLPMPRGAGALLVGLLVLAPACAGTKTADTSESSATGGGVGGDGSDGTDGGGGDGTDGGDGSDGACDTLEVAACQERADCRTIDGRAAQTGASGAPCVDYSEAAVPVGCMDLEMGCDDAITAAQDPATGALWIFSSGCVPAGWTSGSWSYEECR